MTHGLLPLPQPDTQPLQHVLRVLQLTRTGETRFTGYSLPEVGNRIYGGQVMSQALIAAAETVDAEKVGMRLPHSMHGYFLRPGRTDEPLEFSVEILHDGRSFSTRRTHALQGGVPILSMIYSFQLEQPGVDHEVPAPEAPDPIDLPSAADLFAEVDHPAARRLMRLGAFELRHVEPDIYFTPDPERRHTQRLWMRTRTPLPDRTPQVLHRALLAYACDQVMLEPILRAHGLSWTSGLAVASLDHAMWWHRPLDVSRCLLYVQESPSAEGGRGLGFARIYSSDGRLVATAAQQGMVRVPRD
jgi:Acyl-CoA thioesterase